VFLREAVTDLNAMDNLLYHLHVFYYVLKEKRIPKNYIASIEGEIMGKLSEYREYLCSAGKIDEHATFLKTIRWAHKNNGLMDFEKDGQV